MTMIAVLDDNTRDAYVIGQAADAEAAADVFMGYNRERMEADDFATLARPTFAFRNPLDLYKGLRGECPNGAFEPLF